MPDTISSINACSTGIGISSNSSAIQLNIKAMYMTWCQRYLTPKNASFMLVRYFDAPLIVTKHET